MSDALPPTDPALIGVGCCTLFHSLFRLELALPAAALPADPTVALEVAVHAAGGTPPQKRAITPDGAGWRITVEALVDPADFPDAVALALRQGERTWRLSAALLLARAGGGEVHPLLPEFRAATLAAPGRPRLLDIGGRARSGIQRSDGFPHCDTTVLDIIAAPGVDVVADAHAMSAHLPAEHFDFALSIAVFEHLAMPWKVAVEMARVLRPGGLALVISHQTIGMHDLPWDFLRFSDAAWSGLFNRATGFEIVATRMAGFMHILPRAWTPRHRGAEAAGGYEVSAVIARRVGPPSVDWPVRLGDILATRYPGG